MSRKKYFCYHKSNRDATDRCNTLKDEIKEIIQKGKLDKCVKKEEEHKHSRSFRKGKVVVNDVRNASKYDDSDFASRDDKQKSRGRLVAMVISGGYPVESGEIEK